MAIVAAYQLILNFDGVKRLSDGAFIPNAPGNKDWNEYLNWLALGNEPLSVEDPLVGLDELIYLTLEVDRVINGNFSMLNGSINNKSSLAAVVFFEPLGTVPETAFEIIVPPKDSKPFPGNVRVVGGLTIHKINNQVSILFTKRLG